MRFAELDAVTLDAHGTLVELADPVPDLDRGLRERGIERTGRGIARAFSTEVEYYREHAYEGCDAETLARLRLRCTGVFLDALEAELAAEAFVDAFVGSIRFEALPGTQRSLRTLRRRGLALAVVSNWDVGLNAHLDEVGLGGLVVVTSAEAGASKPAPAAFELAIERLGVRPDRTLHIGDSDADEEGARAAGLQFAPAPLSPAFGA